MTMYVKRNYLDTDSVQAKLSFSTAAPHPRFTFLVICAVPSIKLSFLRQSIHDTYLTALKECMPSDIETCVLSLEIMTQFQRCANLQAYFNDRY